MEVVILWKGGGRHSVLIAYSSHRRCLHYDSVPFRLAESLLQRLGAIRYIVSKRFITDFARFENPIENPIYIEQKAILRYETRRHFVP